MKNRFNSIRNAMRFNDSGRVLARSAASPFAIYDEPAGGAGGEGGAGGAAGGAGGAAKTYTQAEVDAQIAGLKGKNTELLDKYKKATDRVKDLPEDATPEEIQEAIANQRKSKQEQLEAKGQYDKLLAQMGEKHTQEKRKLEDKNTALTQRIQTKEKRLAINSALAQFEGDIELLTPHILAQLDVEEDGDEYVVFVKDSKGNAIVGADGKKKSVEVLVAEMAENPKYAGAFKAPNVSGGGARNAGDKTTSNGDVILTGEQAKDVKTYRAARERATKAGGTVVIRG